MKYMDPAILGRFLRTVQNGSRLLGLDVGEKYVGLAISDPLNKVASPLSVLVRKKSNLDLVAMDFQKLVSELSVAGFVVGLPLDRYQKSRDGNEMHLFVDDLSRTGKLNNSLPYTYWNECFSSKVIDLLIEPLKLHPVEAKTMHDKFAAVTILQGYLDYMNKRLKSEAAEANPSDNVVHVGGNAGDSKKEKEGLSCLFRSLSC
ncbi:unnamed protein product [Linum tenue]|uniref:YqgF/RNase H-like domain-containing protein n=1 Tax=Linum tenue TaxID=586396 RepID=A0AAV0JY72_9ROSI|nr:unnamed protein product [Linum tenue]